MALFSVNQNVQWFTPTSAEIAELKKAANTSTLLKKASGKVWFSARSGKDANVSEVINIANGGYVKFVAADDMKHTAKCVKLVMDSNVNSGTPVDGQVYGIYINQRGYQALGENQFGEFGAEVRYGSKFDLGNGPEVINSAAKLLNALALGLVRNLNTDNNLYRVVVATASDAACTEVSANTDLHSTSTASLYILEKEQDWIQGTMQREQVQLSDQDIHFSEVTINTLERNDWGKATNIDLTDTSTYSTLLSSLGTANVSYAWVNSKDIADMEWFYLGEHGDQQRLVGYPNVHPVQLGSGYYNIYTGSDSSIAGYDGYDLIYIHHSYVGNGVFVQKSEQDIIIAVPKNVDTTGSNTYSDGNLIADKIALALGAITSGHVTSKAVLPF